MTRTIALVIFIVQVVGIASGIPWIALPCGLSFLLMCCYFGFQELAT